MSRHVLLELRLLNPRSSGGGPLAVGCVLFSKDVSSKRFLTREERVSFLAPAGITPVLVFLLLLFRRTEDR